MTPYDWDQLPDLLPTQARGSEFFAGMIVGAVIEGVLVLALVAGLWAVS